MSLVVPSIGEVQLLKNCLFLDSFTLRLFSNNVTLGLNTVKTDLTEVSGGGYAAATLLKANWIFTAGSGVEPSSALYNTFVTFAFSGTPAIPTAYGYYVLDASANLLYAEKFSSVVALANGVSIPVKPQFTLRNAS